MVIFSFITLFSFVVDLPRASNHVSMSEFIELYGQEGIALIRNAQQNYIPNYSIEREGDTLRIAGDITLSMYEEISNKLTKHPIKRFVITSPGGDIDAGIKIGYLMHENKIDIEVIDRCVSSCANYLFTAAVRKKIHDGAVVVWHGNTEQKDWREFDLCGRTVSSFDGLPMPEDEIAELSTFSSQKEWEERREQEKTFYELVGVDNYLSRVGQEPFYLGDFTMTVMDMNKFGLTNITAPTDYANEEYCSKAKVSNPSLICMSVTEEHLEYEQARRRFGERCTEDGFLTINYNLK